MMSNLLYTAPFDVTQGGADTSAEVTIATGLLPGIDLSAWELVMIELQLSSVIVKTWAAADSNMVLQLTKRSLVGAYATLKYADTDLITQYQIATILSGAAANISVQQCSFWFELPPGALVYAAAMYLQIMSVGTAATNSLHGRIMYRPVKLTQNEALAIVASRP